jgi:hypothetical protein
LPDKKRRAAWLSFFVWKKWCLALDFVRPVEDAAEIAGILEAQSLQKLYGESAPSAAAAVDEIQPVLVVELSRKLSFHNFGYGQVDGSGDAL